MNVSSELQDTVWIVRRYADKFLSINDLTAIAVYSA
jgi:hypothetical protein